MLVLLLTLVYDRFTTEQYKTQESQDFYFFVIIGEIATFFLDNIKTLSHHRLRV
jgi:hypothetical protein